MTYTYDSFFTNGPIDAATALRYQLTETPNRRDRFHLDGIGMEATIDVYGLVLVATSNTVQRLIVKDFHDGDNGYVIVDVSLPMGYVESVLLEYSSWGRAQLDAVRNNS